MLNLPQQNLFEAEFAKITNRAITNYNILTGAVSGVTLNTPFPANSDLSSQLQMIAKIIAVRDTARDASPNLLLLRRRIRHSQRRDSRPKMNLLTELSQCMNAFYQATKELGIADRVTLFTASDFSRTFQSNGGGADHGWGSHALVLGDSVKGGDIYGAYPTIAIEWPGRRRRRALGPDHFRRRILRDPREMVWHLEPDRSGNGASEYRPFR